MERAWRSFVMAVILCAFCAGMPAVVPPGWSQNDPDPEAERSAASGGEEARETAPESRADWGAEKAALFDEMAQMAAEVRQLEWERRQTEAFTRDLAQKTADLSVREAEAEALRDRIGPLLEATHARLSDQVSTDLPFAEETRKTRLIRLRRILDDADAGPVEKVRVLLDILTSEVEAGYAAEVGTADIRVGGETVRVRRLHVGRLGLYALSPDGRSAWLWNPEGEEWAAIPEHARAVTDAIRIARGQRLAELVALPVSPPEIMEEEGE